MFCQFKEDKCEKCTDLFVKWKANNISDIVKFSKWY